MAADQATPGRWRAEFGSILTKLPEEDRDRYVALVELPASRLRDGRQVLQEQDANAALMAHAKQMWWLLERAEQQLKLQSVSNLSLLEDIRLLKLSVKEAIS